MTALDEFARLESTGLWRPTPQEQRREVGLCFGDATLVLTDSANRPLTHWSLPAVHRINPGVRPALYSPDPDGIETLEISDDLMVDALEKVHRGLSRQRPRVGRLRQSIWLITAAAIVALSVLWLPGAMIRQAGSVVPAAKRSEIGATLLGHIQRLTGPTCRNPLGVAALDALRTRVLGEGSTAEVVIVRDRLAAPVALPGPIIMLPLSVVTAADDPAVTAGHILAADLSRTRTDPLERALEDAGLGATFQLLTTGDVPTDTLQAYAQTAVSIPARLPDARTLGAGFEQAAVPISPWATALDPTGATISDLLQVEWQGAVDAPALLTDGQWVSLTGICQ